MIPFLVVKTRKGFAYVRPDEVVAVNASELGECMILLTHGVTIAAIEPAEDIVARLEARAADEPSLNTEDRRHGNVRR